MTKPLLTVILFGCALQACTVIPDQAYYNPGEPRTLLDNSSEFVTLPLAAESDIGELTDWVNGDQPSHAEVYCLESDNLCQQAQEVLAQFNVRTQFTPDTRGEVVLVYERIAARDCHSSFVSNHINPYNLNHPTYGCSVAANAVQMVGEYEQFVNPALLDYHDSRKADQNYEDLYMKETEVELDFDEILELTNN